MKYFKNILFVTIILCSLFLISGCGKKEEETKKTEKEEISYNLGDTFSFMNLEITMGTEYTLKTIDNENSKYNGETAIIVPVTIKNTKTSINKLNTLNYSVTGSNGFKTDTLLLNFINSIETADYLKENESYDKEFAFVYDGDGTYKIIFSTVTDEKIVKIDVSK